LCANSQYAIDVLNIGEAQVYSASNLQPVAKGYATLDGLMGLTTLNWGSGGDISCMYDYANGGHWFFTEIVSTTPEPESAFTGCFAGVTDTCREGIAVSTTNNPMGSYNVYFVDPNKVNHDPGASVANLLNDFAKIGSTRDAFTMFYDEFILNGSLYPACPAFGCHGFNGAQQFAFNKNALEMGWASSKVTVAYENMGIAPNLYPIPADGIFQSASESCFTGSGVGVYCWYQVIPAQTPDPSQYDNNNGGTGFMMGTGDFLSFFNNSGLGDNRTAAFYWTGLSSLNSAGCSSCTNIKFGGSIINTPIVYMNEGINCLAQFGGSCGLGVQKSGPIPLGDMCGAQGLSTSLSCPESGIQTNGDGVTQVSYADGQLWTGVSTQIIQTFGKSTENHMGAAYWDISSGAGPTFSINREGYVSASHEDLEFPAIAATDTGTALMTFTLSGPDYYPSTAYTWLTSNQDTIHITALGKSPDDGFTEYQLFATGYAQAYFFRPRWGDYSWAIFVPGTNGGIFFASNYIQSPNCNQILVSGLPAAGVCDGTRNTFANWGSSVNVLR
jgi:hypothetical protein